jgi:hypothetical protein
VYYYHVVVALLHCSVHRLGGVDFPALLREEWERYDVPRFMCIEGAKLRYLTSTHVTRAMHEGVFEILTGPTLRPPLPALCRHLFKYPAHLPLRNGVHGDVLQDFTMQPARRCWIQQLTAGSGLHIVKLRRLHDSVRLFVSGGVLGSDRVLSGLGNNVERVFLNAWQIPPLFAHPPASRAGMHIKVFAGVAATTAVDWCRPQLHRLRAACAKLDAKKRVEEELNENVVDHSLLRPTAKQEERSRLFALFSKGNPKDPQSVDPAGAKIAEEEADGSAEQETSPFSDSDDDEDCPDAIGPEGPVDAGRTGTGRKARGVDFDSGVLRTMGEVELEVVVRVNFEASSLLDQVRTSRVAFLPPRLVCLLGLTGV